MKITSTITHIHLTLLTNSSPHKSLTRLHLFTINMKFLSVLAVLPFAMAGYVHDCSCSTVKSYDSGVDDSSLVDTYYPTMSSCTTTSYDSAGSPTYFYTSLIPSATEMT